MACAMKQGRLDIQSLLKLCHPSILKDNKTNLLLAALSQHITQPHTVEVPRNSASPDAWTKTEGALGALVRSRAQPCTHTTGTEISAESLARPT